MRLGRRPDRIPAARQHPRPATRAQFGPGARRLGKLLKVNVHGIRAVADFARFEAANDPDESAGTGPDTGEVVKVAI